MEDPVRGMNDLMRQAQQMQNKMLKKQEELGQMTAEGSSGGGMVKVVVTGKQDILSVTIDPSVVDPNDVDMLQDLVLTALNDGMRASREMAEKELTSITGGISIPGLF